MRRGLVTLLLIVLVLAACGGGSDGAGDGGAGSGGWLSLLAAVPDTPGNRLQVIANDYAAARDLLGITAPPGDASEDVLVDYTMTISMGRRVAGDDGGVARYDPMLDLAAQAAFGARALTAPLEWRAEFGFTIAQLDQDLNAGTPPEEVLLFRGDLDPAVIEAALRADPVWGPEIEVVAHGEDSYFRWRGDFETILERASAARPLGRGGCLAVSDGMVIRTYGSEVMESALDALDGSVPSLADLPQAADLAAALEAAGVYSAFFAFDVSPFNQIDNPLDVVSGEVDPSAGEWLRPYLALATGAGLDDSSQPTAVFALAHADAETAEANGAWMERMLTEGVSLQAGGRPWSDLITGHEVSVTGTTLVAILWTEGPPRLWRQVPFVRDSLLLWEP